MASVKGPLKSELGNKLTKSFLSKIILLGEDLNSSGTKGTSKLLSKFLLSPLPSVKGNCAMICADMFIILVNVKKILQTSKICNKLRKIQEILKYARKDLPDWLIWLCYLACNSKSARLIAIFLHF